MAESSLNRAENTVGKGESVLKRLVLLAHKNTRACLGKG